jgi:hypothetical protein
VHHAIGVFVGEGVEKNGAHDAKDGDAGTDAEGERADYDGGISTSAPELSEAESDVPQQGWQERERRGRRDKGAHAEYLSIG